MAILHLIINLYSMHRLIPDWYLSKRERVYCAFIDYKKAFDLVDRTSLWRKLLKNYVDGNFFRVINHGWCRTLLLLLLQLFAMAWTQQIWPLIRWRSSAISSLVTPTWSEHATFWLLAPKFCSPIFHHEWRNFFSTNSDHGQGKCKSRLKLSRQWAWSYHLSNSTKGYI